MGLVEEREVLATLQRQIETHLEKVGFQPEDRTFHPHLTLGRMRSGRGKGDLVGRIEKYKEEKFGDLPVERVVLFKSDLRPSGPIYTPLREMKLGEQNNSREIGR